MYKRPHFKLFELHEGFQSSKGWKPFSGELHIGENLKSTA